MKRSFKYTRCDKCKDKAIYILDYKKPVIALCKFHCPQLSTGAPSYEELTIISTPPIGYNVVYYEPSSVAPKDKCYVCGKLIKNLLDFTYQFIKNVNTMTSDKFIGSSFQPIPAVPVIEIEYYICKKGCGE